MQNKYLRLSSNQWIWGPSTHWRLYYFIKKCGRRWVSSVITEGHNHPCQEDISVESKQDDKVKLSIDGTSTSFSRQFFINYTSRKKKSKLDFRRCSSSSVLDSSISLTNSEANEIVWSNEKTININIGSVSHCQTNQLASNVPNEDQLSVTKSSLDDGMLFTILDGHGGHFFGENVKIRLPYYLHAALSNSSYCSINGLNSTIMNLLGDTPAIKSQPWFQNLKNFLHFKEKSLFQSNFLPHVPNRDSNNENNIGILRAIRHAFLQLDSDMIEELCYLSRKGQFDSKSIGSALSGCCALIAYILKDELYIANAGDCRAVLGSKSGNGWSAVQLTNDHTTAANPEEVQKILSEHPPDEARSCLQYGRLLSRLAPLRALGDMQFKLTNEQLCEIFKSLPKYSPIASSKTPPYLTAEPDVFHYKLDENDQFVVLASDGLWDMLSNHDVVELVAAYLEGRQIDVLKEKAFLNGVPNYEDIISSDEAFMETKDENVASYLIRLALGGYDPKSVQSMLSIPHPDLKCKHWPMESLKSFLSDDHIAWMLDTMLAVAGVIFGLFVVIIIVFIGWFIVWRMFLLRFPFIRELVYGNSDTPSPLTEQKPSLRRSSRLKQKERLD